MTMSEIDELENKLECSFSNIGTEINNIRLCALDNDINIDFNRIQNNIRVSFEDVKKQLENLRIEIIRKE